MSWESRRLKEQEANALRTQSECNASKVKESKVKESKVKESKEKEIKKEKTTYIDIHTNTHMSEHMKNENVNKDISTIKTENKKTPKMIFDTYNRLNIKLPQAGKYTKGRAEKCAIRIKEKDFLEDFEKAVLMAQNIPFLCGKGKQGWKADFDWMVTNDTNIIKIIEGKYGDSENKKSNQFEFLEEVKDEQENIH